MLTLHTAGLLLPGGGRAAVPGGGVLVDGDRIAALGAAGELTPAYPAARVRTWPGTLRAGLVHTGPLPAAATARERVHAVLRLGACALTSPDLTDAERRRPPGWGCCWCPSAPGLRTSPPGAAPTWRSCCRTAPAWPRLWRGVSSTGVPDARGLWPPPARWGRGAA